jgi:hypothetical protein
MIITPNHNDVLMGRGGRNNEHPGNVQLRSFALQNASTYNECPRLEKHKIYCSLVEKVKATSPPGRFLRQDPKTRLWHEVDDKKAREKASQHLRDATKEFRPTKCENSFIHYPDRFATREGQIRKMSLSYNEEYNVPPCKIRRLDDSSSEPLYHEPPITNQVIFTSAFQSPLQMLKKPTMHTQNDQITVDDWENFLTRLPIENSQDDFNPLQTEEHDSLYGKEDGTVDTVESDASSWEYSSGCDTASVGDEPYHLFMGVDHLVNV